MNKRNLIIGVVAFWVIAVLGFVGYMEYVKNSGEIVIVKVIPVDPRDILRGDFVTLGFPFSNQETKNITGKTVYAIYEKGPDNRLINIVSYEDEMPANGQAIKGNISDSAFGRAEYGIEQFFVPEGRGMEIQEAIRNKNVEAEIAIDSFGRGIIKHIIIDGVVWKP